MKLHKLFENETKTNVPIDNLIYRYIGPADNINEYITKSLHSRQDQGLLSFQRKFEFIIFDRNQSKLDKFKNMLTWPVEAIKSVNGFEDFALAWNTFRHCHFEFFNVDIVTESDKFIEKLLSLQALSNRKMQYIRLDIDNKNYSKQDYRSAVNDILQVLWIKNIKEYTSIVKVFDDNNNIVESYAGNVYAAFNPTFCVLPWMHIQYKPTGQSKLCCRYDNIHEIKMYDQLDFDKEFDLEDTMTSLRPEHDELVIQKISMEDTFHSNYWNTARQCTTENAKISGCHKCYKEERVLKGEVQLSMRLSSSILYNNGFLHKKPKFEQPKIEFLEVGFGNYCNLACLTCNSSLSTTWHDDETKLNNILGNSPMKRMLFKKLEDIRFEPDETTLKSLKLIKFTGGEPMINPEFVRFIELICDKGTPENINLEIYTNCSYIPSPKLLTNLTKFKNVQLNLSVDAYGNANDFIRYGSKWTSDSKQNVSSALDHYLDLGLKHSNIAIIMSATLSVLNILEVPKLLDWWMDKFKDSGNKIVVYRDALLPTEYDGFFKLQLAYDPAYININILPAEYYHDILDWITTYWTNYTTRYPDLKGVPECIGATLLKLQQTINKANGNREECKNFLNYLTIMDQIRGTQSQQAVPDIIARVKKYLDDTD